MKTMVSRSRRFVRVRCFLCGNASNGVSEDETFFRALCVCVYVREGAGVWTGVRDKRCSRF